MKPIYAFLIACLFQAAVCRGEPRPDIVMATFEEKNWSPWQTEGEGFGEGPFRPGDDKRFAGREGNGVAWSGRSGMERQGILLSPEFKIERRYLNFLVTGRRDLPRRLGVELLVDDRVVRASSATEYMSLDMIWRTWDVGLFVGRTARIRINDHSTFGGIAVDQFVQSDTAKAQPTDASVHLQETFRPGFHFTAQSGWLNDANGLFYYKGRWHLFHQHRPPDGPAVVWGHATSEDLVHWRHQPTAISADNGDACFSGSAAIDWDNTSGLRRAEDPPIVLCFTLHPPADSGRKATQCLAFSADVGQTFGPFAGNPVLCTKDNNDRDPKLFFHKPTRAWIMVLSLSRNNADREHATYGLYRSSDLRSWELLQEIGPGSWYWECPDMFEMPLDGDSHRSKWLLVKGSGDYILGTFDGRRFQAETEPIRIQWHNAYYGAQTFSDAPDGRRIQIGWMHTTKAEAPKAWPGMPFNQQMSVPRELTLRSTPAGPRLFRQPVAELERLRTRTRDLGARALAPGENALADVAPGLLDIELEIDLGHAAQLSLGCRGAELTYDVKSQKLRLLRADPVLSLTNGRLALRVLIDRTSIEAFASAGEVDVSGVYFPRADDRRLSLGVQGGQANIRRLVVHELKPIW